MKEIIRNQGSLEQLELPETTDDLDAVAAEPGFALEFLKKVKNM